MNSKSYITNQGDVYLSVSAKGFIEKVKPIVEDWINGLISKERMLHLVASEIVPFEKNMTEDAEDEYAEQIENLENQIDDQKEIIKALQREIERLEEEIKDLEKDIRNLS